MGKKYFLLIFCFIVCMNIYSQGTLSLQECRELAIAHNKSLKIAGEEERVAYYEKKDAFTKYFPELSFTGAYLRNQKDLNLLSSSSIPSSITIPDLTGMGLPFPGGQFPIDEQTRNTIKDLGRVEIKNVWVGGFSLTQPVFMGGKIVAYNDIQKYAEQLARSKKDTKLTDVIVDVDNTYWQIVSLSNKKGLAESYVSLLSKMDSDITSMVEEGVATKADQLSVRVKLNEAEMTLLKVSNGLSLSKIYLSQICGLNMPDNISLVDESVGELKSEKENIGIPNIEEAFANRQEVKSLDLATKIYEKKEKIALSEFMPQVAFIANYLWTNPSSFDGFEKKFGGMWNVGVMVKVPLNFFSSSAKLNASKSQTRIAKYQLSDVRDKIELQVNQSIYKMSEANKKLTLAEKNMEKADENVRYANAGFEEGVITASDVMTAQTAWVSAHSEYIDAQIDIKLCRIYLDKALGRTLSE